MPGGVADRRRPVLLIFLDGVGIGPADPERNPFLQARLPTLADLLGGVLPTLDRPRVEGPGATALPLDATLGIAGLPQSGTGQIALLTGENAPRLFGRHFGPWPPVSLRETLRTANLLVRAREAGRRVAFANAYPERYTAERRSRRVAAPPFAAAAAGVLNRHAEALARGDAVASEILNTGWRVHLGHDEVPEVTAEEAGLNLAEIARSHDLTLYAHYATDHAGHRGGMDVCIAALERVDAFLAGVLGGAADAMTVAVVSDHGNVEDVSAQHTRNPALGLVLGPGSAAMSERWTTIADVAPALLEHLESAS